jgi:hypothetical protein
MANPEWDNYKPQQYVHILHCYDPVSDRNENHSIVAVYADPTIAEKERIRLKELYNRDRKNDWAKCGLYVTKEKYFD